MLFEWDEDKDKINTQKHEMPLRAGIPVFDDVNAIEFEDDRFNYGEERFIIIGTALIIEPSFFMLYPR